MPITDKTEIAAVSEHLPSPERSLINTAFFVIIPRLKISEQFNIYLVMLSLYNTTVTICMYNFQNFYRYSLWGNKISHPYKGWLIYYIYPILPTSITPLRRTLMPILSYSILSIVTVSGSKLSNWNLSNSNLSYSKGSTPICFRTFSGNS